MSRPQSVAALARDLQSVTDVPGWVLASSSTVVAIATGRPEDFGPRGRWVKRALWPLGPSFAGQVLLQVIGTLAATFWWVRGVLGRRLVSDCPTILLGFGAGPEAHILAELEREGPVQHLNHTNPQSLAGIVLPSLSSLWVRTGTEARAVARAIRSSQASAIRDNGRLWMVSAALRLGEYVFALAWAEALPARIHRIVLISSSVHAFALVRAAETSGRQVEYRQHGLHKASIVFPAYPRVLAINSLEATHVRQRLPRATVNFRSPTQLPRIRRRGKTVLLAAPYDCAGFRKADYVDEVRRLARWSENAGMTLTVRPHPTDGSAFWRRELPELALDESPGGLGVTLERLAPSLVVGWWSTSLLDALARGILPVLIMPGSAASIADMVCPLANVAMNWPDEAMHISRVLADDESYLAEVESRQKLAFGSAQVEGG